ncbi:hypothetical protein ES332_A10G293900v1 [Gossypium tomentosum]|uniref:AAA+ ATPase domain-containing protein n=1 Tax=Gossypium tomentosum TaxID=34277 RepID=A0A5D2NZ65_GOSTO|nr:hypothetical protein ES332_A10G293900v1 [Gossypium tomentosum]TYI08375.1 hypothetical protein ES332_A10G293900v1 [Gossypium tomentosum]TYI08376.1 hypothetical protein ES332_A10G293900v1 [Gossypium tomentosum]TYI08377.1 hypothetical protein ES332_A10G293900v1 [Gossypium tomentosum]
MDFVVAIVSSIVAKAAEYTISPIINHVKYLSNHQQNVETLKHQAEKLKVARDRVQHSVDAALRNGKEIEGDVDKWLSAVDTKILEQVEKVTQDEEKAKKKCFVGLCPDFWTRYKLSLKAAEEAKAVAELLEQGKFDEVSYPVPLQGITVTPSKGYEDFESRTLVLNEIMEALKDDSVSVIGVHGMGGIGKTTLVKEIARKVKGNLFDSVIIATVTQAIDIEKIQNRIAELLGLKFEEQSTDVKALRLQERLKKEKRVLVVLDDIWAKVDIEEVGIPLGDEHKGCKLLLTSRELNVLSNGMDAQKYFSVGFLNENEAWDLFKKKAGDCVESCDLKPAAMEVAKKCAGLPIAIATVAGALRNKRLFEWKNALRELERPSSSNFTGIAAAYSAIEWSFNYLESEEVKLTFLLCCVIGHNGLVEKLMRYTVGLGLVGGVNTMEEARNEVLTVVANLKASSLLLDSYDDEHFDIHDVVSDAALAIASRDYHMFVLRDHIPKEWSDKAKMNSLRAISLPCPQIIAELPKEIEYSGLSFFHMAHDDSVVIPPDFFRRIESLKVLDLPSYSYLPESINHLIDLRMLCLRGCLVEDITIIGELKSLEILDLAFSRIKELPKEIAQLTRLRLLDLSGCRKLKIIPPNVLSSLSKLEELYMEGNFVEWENGVVDNERRNASLDELNNLSRLTTLYVRISDIQMIPKHRFIETLNRYRIIVGDHPISKWLRRHECSRTLTLQLYTNICLDNGVKMLLGKAEYLYLDLKGLKGIKNVLAELNKGNDFPHLQSLHVKNGIQVQYITMNNIEFSELRFITLERLPQLISFCGQEERCSTSFEPLPLFIKQTYHWSSNLRRLIITGCGKLEHLLSPSVARNLVQLHCFEIVGCESLREIICTEEIEEEEETNNVICFPRLNFLHIDFLRNLIFFCSGNYNIEFPLLKELKIVDCPKLKESISESSIESGMHALFNEKVSIPSLERMTISGLRNTKMIFHNALPPNSFRNLRVLSVSRCESLKNLFPASIAKHLPQLEHLWIRWSGVEEIVSEGEGLEEQPVSFEFPKVSSLTVEHLEKLKCFYKGQHTIVWPMLKKLTTDCSALLMIVGLEDVRIQETKGNGEAVLLVKEVIPNLEKLELRNFSDMDQLPPDLFPRVKVFEVGGGFHSGSSYIFPLIRRFYNLERLKFSNFDFKHVVPCKGAVGTLSPIKNLKLHSSKNLKHVWRKDSELGHILSNLQTLTISRCDDLKNIGASSLSFQNLTTLEVSYCKMMTNLVTPLVVENLVQLTTMKVSDCTEMTEIVTNEGDYHQTIVVRKLKCLEISDLQRLTSFCPGSYTFNFPCLKEVVVERCPRLKVFSEGVLSTPQLQRVKQGRDNRKECWKGDLNTTIHQLYTKKGGFNSPFDLNISETFPKLIEIWKRNPQEILESKNLGRMEIYKCSSLKYIFTPSMLFSLKQLEQIEVKECNTMEQVIREDEEGATIHTLTLPKLSFVKIERCSNLTNFYLGSQPLEIPNLWVITIAECPKMTAFSSTISRKSEKVIEERDVEDNITVLFCDKVVIPHLENLKLSSINIQKIWHHPSYSPERNQMFSTLRSLCLEDLPKLKDTCFENSFEFPCLRDLTLKNCPLLKTFISKSVCEDKPQIHQPTQTNNSAVLNEKVVFPRLEKLLIQGCDSLEEIIELQALNASEAQSTSATRSTMAETMMTKFVFPRLTHLGLDKVPSLKSFYSRMHTTQWPSLKFMKVIECPRAQIFCEVEIPNQQPLFCVNEDTFPVLQELTLKTNDMIKGICDGQLSLQCFPNLKLLNLQFFPETSTTLPYSFIQSLPKLEKLVINNASISEIVRFEGLINEERHTSACYQLEALRLSQLPELTLKTLEPFLLSFKNLLSMEVSRCHGFINLMACSTAKSLTLLERLSIADSELIEEIISCEDEDLQASIVFPKLKYLQLSHLPSLASFSLAHHSLEFSVLQMVIVTDCPKMKNFSQGELSTPRLEHMHLTRDEDGELQWEGDLNTTIKHMFDQMNMQNSQAIEVTDQLLQLE